MYFFVKCAGRWMGWCFVHKLVDGLHSNCNFLDHKHPKLHNAVHVVVSVVYSGFRNPPELCYLFWFYFMWSLIYMQSGFIQAAIVGIFDMELVNFQILINPICWNLAISSKWCYVFVLFFILLLFSTPNMFLCSLLTIYRVAPYLNTSECNKFKCNLLNMGVCTITLIMSSHAMQHVFCSSTHHVHILHFLSK